jgi:hypothetical protein
MIPPDLPPLTEIICIDAKPRMTPVSLIKGQLYQVRAYNLHASGIISVLLVGVSVWVHPLNAPDEEIGFFRDRFRLPIIPKLFTDMLEVVPIKIRGRVIEPVD